PWKKQAAIWKKPVGITKPWNVKSPIATIEFFSLRENCRKGNKSRPRFGLGKVRWPDKSKPQTNALPNWKTSWPENKRRWKRTKASERHCGPRKMTSQSAQKSRLTRLPNCAEHT